MQPEQQPPSQWQFAPGEQQQQPTAPVAPASSGVSWSASEFIAYHKSSGWYLQVLLIVAALAAVAFFITHDFISTGSIAIVGVMFIVFAGRKPRVLNYAIDQAGVHVGEKLYAFSMLRSFAVIDEGTLRSISVLPAKRFMPALSMYFEPQDEQKIIEVLGSFLPKEDRKQDAVDRFMHKIRF